MASPSRLRISQRYLIRREPNEQAVFSVSASNQGGRRTGSRTNLTGLRIDSAFPNAARATRLVPGYKRGRGSAEETDDPPSHFIYCRYRNCSIVCKERTILPLGTFSVSINFSFSRNYCRNVDKESWRPAIFHSGPFITPRIQFSLKEGGLMAGSSIIYKWCLVQ